MVRFDQVLETLVSIVEMDPVAEAIEGAGVVRDLRGQVRLFLKFTAGSNPELEPLQQRIEQALGNYFIPPIWVIGAKEKTDAGRLARKMYDEYCVPWLVGTIDDPSLGKRPARGTWRKYEGRLSKQMWLDDGEPGPPWPPLAQRPAIVTFYSFKGGVGRTTALVSCAWQLAREGKYVAVIDLDLEAPSLGTLLAETQGPGVIDFIVDWLATGSRDIGGLYHPAIALGPESNHVTVLPAGQLDIKYLEKLARLDFLGPGLREKIRGPKKSPVEEALTALLNEIARELTPSPDYILLDSRAGLHDLAGLSLHGLAHIDVMLGRASQQGYEGLKLTLRTLGRRKKEKLECIVVHTLAPPDPTSPEAQGEEQRFRQESYRIFQEHIYPGDMPAEEDAAAPHYPIVLRQDSRLERFVSLKGNPSVADALLGGSYRNLYERIRIRSQWKS